MTAKLILTGFMATGKTAVGRLLARELGWRFIDTDVQISTRTGKSIPEIFAQDGEARFRALERETIAAIENDHRQCPQCGNVLPAVISTGGGVLIDEQNCAVLKRMGTVVCLTARPEIIAGRVAHSATRRPKLMEGGKPLQERIHELMSERAAAYSRADVAVDTSDLSLERVVNRVISSFLAHEKSRCRPSA